jgi:hypothetical protein
MVVQFALKTMELNNLKQRAMGLLPNVPDYIDGYIPGYANKAKAFSGFVDNVVEGAIDNTKKQFGELRKAGAVLSGNPYSLVLNDLIFPPAMADGTLTGAIKKHGYEAAPSQVFTGPPESYKYDSFDQVPKNTNIRTMEFRDANSNGIDDRDERGLPNSNESTFIVPSGTSDDDIDQILLRRSGLLGRF